MTRINMGSDSTLIAVAAIPPRIWEQDQAIWKAWLVSLDVEYHSKQQYKKNIADFYYLIELPIQQVTEQHLSDYEACLLETRSPVTVKRIMSPIRRYWTFAQWYKPEEVTACTH